MTTKRAKAYIYGTKEKKRSAAQATTNVRITDRVTANKAKNFVYGDKKKKRLAHVSEMNLYIEDCILCVPPEPHPLTTTITAASNSRCLTIAFWCLSMFVLHTGYSLVLYYVF
jgi:hypothetical protein